MSGVPAAAGRTSVPQCEEDCSEYFCQEKNESTHPHRLVAARTLNYFIIPGINNYGLSVKVFKEVIKHEVEGPHMVSMEGFPEKMFSGMTEMLLF